MNQLTTIKTLIDLPVKEGQRVKKGDLVAKLDPRDYETSLGNAKGGMAKAKVAIPSLQNMTDVDVVIDVPEMMMIPIRKTHPRLFAEFAADPNRHFELKIKIASVIFSFSSAMETR